MKLLIAIFCFIQVAVAQERFILENPSVSLKKQMQSQGKVVKQMKYQNHLVVSLTKAEAKKLNAKPDLVMKASVSALRASGGKTTTKPPQEVPWGISRVGAVGLPFKGSGIKVCVVDTGVSKTHPDLRVLDGENFVMRRNKVDPLAWSDDNGHGSHVAGTIAALDNSEGVVGVAPNATLVAVKVLDSRGSGYLSDVADGILSCVQKGSHIINMSLGSNGDPNLDSPLKSAINQAVSAGVIVVVAAGNEGESISNKIPAGYSNVIAVAASDSSDRIASWSNWNLRMQDFTGPGVGVKSTWMGTGYNTISGTSMASPHVAGIFALILESMGTATTQVLGWGVSEEGSGLLRADLSI